MTNVFFYGLFMDENLLKHKGLAVKNWEIGYVEGYSLVIGNRASLIPSKGARCYGVLMKLSTEELKWLYSEQSVKDYQAIQVSVYVRGISNIADCYVLDSSNISGSNSEYATKLYNLSKRLELPEEYQLKIKSFI